MVSGEFSNMIVLPPNTRIQTATEADLPELARLAGVIWRQYYPAIIVLAQIEYMLARMYSLETLVADVRERGIRYERLLVGDAFRGFAAFGPTEVPNRFKLHKLYLDPACHGQGLGSLLLAHCEREGVKLGASQMTLNVNKQNIRAIAAYQRNGYAITESVVVDIGGGFVMDDLVMGKVIVV